MNDHIGVTTHDLRILGIPDPAERTLSLTEREEATQQHGLCCRRWGTGLIIGTVGATFAAALASDHNLFSDPDARLFAMLAMIGLLLFGAVLVAGGLAERRQQHNRALLRHAITQQDIHAEALAHISAALVKISEVVPLELDQRWFSGYAKGAKDELLDTGTDGTSRTDPPIPFGRRSPRRHL